MANEPTSPPQADELIEVMEIKLYLWKNHVDGRPEYWAFDNLYPCHPNGDPMTLGEPCGYALVKSSMNGCPEITTQSWSHLAASPLASEDPIIDRMARAIHNEQGRDAWLWIPYRLYYGRLAKAAHAILAPVMREKDAEIERLRTEREWQPIETAPRDGTRILAMVKHGAVHIVYWDNEARFERFAEGPGWQLFICEDGYYSIAFEDGHLTHWMPLPKPQTGGQQ